MTKSRFSYPLCVFALIVLMSSSAPVSAELPVCPIDETQMAQVPPELIGVSVKGLATDSAGVVAQRMRSAHVQSVHLTISWSRVETARGVFNWSYYDGLVAPFLEQGIEVSISIVSTPLWATSQPLADFYWRYPPADLVDWTNFVAAAVAHFPETRDWGVWNEPNQPGFWLGTIGEYVEMLDAAYPVIHAVNEGARVAAPTMTYHPWSQAQVDTLAWTERVITESTFDVFSMNTFYFTVDDMVDAINHNRELLDFNGLEDMPISVFEVNLVETVVDCTNFSSQPEEFHATNLQDIYSCFANAGVESLYWFKASDTQMCNDDNSVINRNGLLNELLEPKEPYNALRDIAFELNDGIFADYFESGDTSAWSLVVGLPEPE